MLITTLKTLLEGTGYPVSYGFARATIDELEVPFIVYDFAYSNNLQADDHVYRQRNRYTIQLITKYKDPTAEGKVEEKLDTNYINWDKTETFLDDEDVYRIIYTIFER